MTNKQKNYIHHKKSGNVGVKVQNRKMPKKVIKNNNYEYVGTQPSTTKENLCHIRKLDQSFNK